MKDRLTFILGCTASGKGSLGRELARRLGGQIISVDSMKVYRRMDIGTAKPSIEARREIPHHAIDVVEPGESFSVAQFVDVADRAAESIRSQGSIPLAVGGTNLYIKALSEGLFDGPSADPAIRRELRRRCADEGPPILHAELAEVDPESAERIHPNDQRRIIRALEVYRASGTPISVLQQQWENDPNRRYEAVMIGLRWSKDDQNRRINARAKTMMEAGLLAEVESLLTEPAGLSAQAAQAVGYAEMIDHIQGRCSLEEAFERIKINTRRLAKKQRTWQKRWTHVRWFDCTPGDTAESLAERVLREVEIR